MPDSRLTHSETANRETTAIFLCFCIAITWKYTECVTQWRGCALGEVGGPSYAHNKHHNIGSRWKPCTTSENTEKVLKGSNYDGTAGSTPILDGMPDYEEPPRSLKTPTEINWMMTQFTIVNLYAYFFFSLFHSSTRSFDDVPPITSRFLPLPTALVFHHAQHHVYIFHNSFAIFKKSLKSMSPSDYFR